MKKIILLFAICVMPAMARGDVGGVDFTGNSTSSASITDLNGYLANLVNFSIEAWLKPTSYPGVTNVYLKGLSGSANAAIQFAAPVDTTGNVRFSVVKTVTNTTYTTNDSPMRMNVWNYVGAAFNNGNGGGASTRICVGSDTTTVTESAYGTATNGSALQSTQDQLAAEIGNSRNLAGSYPGYIFSIRISSFQRSCAQMEADKFDFVPDSSTIWFGVSDGSSFSSGSSTITFRDLSANRNDAIMALLKSVSDTPAVKKSGGSDQ